MTEADTNGLNGKARSRARFAIKLSRRNRMAGDPSHVGRQNIVPLAAEALLSRKDEFGEWAQNAEGCCRPRLHSIACLIVVPVA